jgi:Trk-type K+ transport system membrane component
MSVFLLSITETEILNTAGRSVLDLIFEEVSAICTVGLSTGITSQLSEAGKIIIIASMFIGRVGTLTIAFAVSKRVISLNYKYPKAHMLVG